MTVAYAIVQMIVLVGVIIQIAEEPCSPNAIFFYFVAGSFILAGLLHPQVRFVCTCNDLLVKWNIYVMAHLLLFILFLSFRN